jgi:hypothetical protein
VQLLLSPGKFEGDKQLTHGTEGDKQLTHGTDGDKQLTHGTDGDKQLGGLHPEQEKDVKGKRGDLADAKDDFTEGLRGMGGEPQLRADCQGQHPGLLRGAHRPPEAGEGAGPRAPLSSICGPLLCPFTPL